MRAGIRAFYMTLGVISSSFLHSAAICSVLLIFDRPIEFRVIRELANHSDELFPDRETFTGQ